jgi:hypothetical protein
MDLATSPTNSRDCGTPNGAAKTSSLIPFDRWLRDLGKSRATGWRWRRDGVVTTHNVFGRHYVTLDEIGRFERAALSGEFARAIATPLRQS